MRLCYAWGIAPVLGMAACAQIAGIEDARPGWTIAVSSTTGGSGGTGVGGSGGSSGSTTSTSSGTAGGGTAGSGTGGMGCGGGAPTCGGALMWVSRIGGADDQHAVSATLDPANDVHLAGNYSGSIDIGSGPVASAGATDVFLTTLDLGGAPSNLRHYGDSNYQTVTGMATDSAGNTVIAGTFSGTVDFGGAPLVASTIFDAFVAKFNIFGVHEWSKRFVGAGAAPPQLSVDHGSNVVLAGAFHGVVNFGGDLLEANGDVDNDVFVVMFDSDGNHVWSKRFGDVAAQVPTGLAVDPSGNVLIAGWFASSLDFGGKLLLSTGDQNIFLAKLDPQGGYLWSKRFGDAMMDSSRTHVAAGSAGNVMIVGEAQGTVDFGGGPLQGSNNGDQGFAASFDASGEHVWSKRLETATCHAVTADNAGNMLLTGEFGGMIDFGAGMITSLSAADGFVAKLDGTGHPSWVRHFPDSVGRALVADPMGNTFVAGDFTGTVDFGGVSLTSSDKADIFVLGLSP